MSRKQQQRKASPQVATQASGPVRIETDPASEIPGVLEEAPALGEGECIGGLEEVPGAEPLVEMIGLELPFALPPAGSYIESQAGRLDVRLDRETQLPGFRQLHAGLRQSNATFKDGRPVDTAADVFRWLCEQITTAIP